MGDGLHFLLVQQKEWRNPTAPSWKDYIYSEGRRGSRLM